MDYGDAAREGADGSAVVNVQECARLLCLWLDVEDNGYRVDGLGEEHAAEMADAAEDERGPA